MNANFPERNSYREIQSKVGQVEGWGLFSLGYLLHLEVIKLFPVLMGGGRTLGSNELLPQSFLFGKPTPNTNLGYECGSFRFVLNSFKQ